MSDEQTVFVHFISGEYEWGFDVPAGYIPAVGDDVHLWLAVPDGKKPDDDYGIFGIVVKRSFCFVADSETDDGSVDYFVEIRVDLSEEVLPGYVADSQAWPAAEWTMRNLKYGRPKPCGEKSDEC